MAHTNPPGSERRLWENQRDPRGRPRRAHAGRERFCETKPPAGVLVPHLQICFANNRLCCWVTCQPRTYFEIAMTDPQVWQGPQGHRHKLPHSLQPPLGVLSGGHSCAGATAVTLPFLQEGGGASFVFIKMGSPRVHFLHLAFLRENLGRRPTFPSG